VLRVGGGGGDLGERRYAVRYWLSPLPAGTAVVEFEWPALEIDRRQVPLDGDALTEALR
jgi:hypothetical protein